VAPTPSFSATIPSGHAPSRGWAGHTLNNANRPSLKGRKLPLWGEYNDRDLPRQPEGRLTRVGGALLERSSSTPGSRCARGILSAFKEIATSHLIVSTCGGCSGGRCGAPHPTWWVVNLKKLVLSPSRPLLTVAPLVVGNCVVHGGLCGDIKDALNGVKPVEEVPATTTIPVATNPGQTFTQVRAVGVGREDVSVCLCVCVYVSCVVVLM